jgi:hypothetical protein
VRNLRLPADLSEVTILQIADGPGTSGFLEIHRLNSSAFSISAELQEKFMKWSLKSSVTLSLRSDNRGAIRDVEASDVRNLIQYRFCRLRLLSLASIYEESDSMISSETVKDQS